MSVEKTGLIKLSPGLLKRSLIGVSGGRDSVALLHLLHSAGCRRLIVCHVNHGLRGRASGQDAAFVRKLAENLGYEFEGTKLNVKALAKDRKQSIELTARNVRLEFFAALVRKHRCARVILAHHADDQAETVLMRMLRGTGIGGLAGMSEETEVVVGKTKLVLLRPLLGVRRSDIDAYVVAQGIRFREDSTNGVAEATRNRVRLDLIPHASAVRGHDVVPMLVRLAGIARRDDQLLSALAEELRLSVVASDGSLALSSEFKVAHEALQYRVVMAWLQKWNVPGIDQETVEDVVRLATQFQPSRVNLPSGLQVRRKSGRLTIARQ